MFSFTLILARQNAFQMAQFDLFGILIMSVGKSCHSVVLAVRGVCIHFACLLGALVFILGYFTAPYKSSYDYYYY